MRRASFLLVLAAAVGLAAMAAIPAGALPPGPPPTNSGPYGGYGLWLGTCPPQAPRFPPNGKYGNGEITTHWDQYRGSAAVQYLVMVAAFSDTSTPKTPVYGQTYTNIQNVDHPTWGKPIPVGWSTFW